LERKDSGEIMRRRLLLGAVFILLGFSTSNAQKRNITAEDIFSFTWIGDTQVSPDGSRAIYVQTTVSAKRDGYETSLFLLDLAQAKPTPRRLTNGPHDLQPRWSPDGSQVAFLRSLEKDGKPQPPQLFLLPLSGGEPAQLTKMEKGVSSPLWSPQGTSIAVLSGTPVVPVKEEPKKNGEKKPGVTDDEHKSDVRIINRAVYRADGEGYLDYKNVPQLYLVSLPQAGKPQADPWQVTMGRFDVDEFAWRPNSTYLYYTSEHLDEPYYDQPHNEIYVLEAPQPDATGSFPAKGTKPPESSLVAKLNFEALNIAISPDGKHMAFLGEERPEKMRSYQQPDMFVLDIDPAQPLPAAPPLRNLTAQYDYEVGAGVGGDNAAPRGGGPVLPAWTPDSKSILDIVGKKGSALLISIDATSGAVKELSAEKQALQRFSISRTAAGKALALISTPVNPGDLFSVALDGSKQQTQLTQVNEALFSQLTLTMPDDMHVTPTANPADIGGQTIEAWVQKPPAFDASKKYPLILNIHGGPHAAYGWIFDHEFQTLAAKGYVVVYPNPRGSTTYGQQFANSIQHNYPGDDFHDLMDSVDAVIKLGYVDPARQGVTGGSGGGLLTNWTVTHTNRFKAAVAQRDITDWANWWYTDDFTLFQPTWFEGPPFEHPEEFKKYSPITYVANIQTPMMFILGEADYRTPPTGGGEDFFRALKYRHIDTVMVRFPNEGHELSRSGQPWHRVERLQNIASWFDKYLMGIPQPQYDIVPPDSGKQ
jgi:dipeptidyl aminopeptidase/acylaminoacyl peptidase